jgi:ABC-type multidrug transport system fused ATPase/permease subunit
MTVLRKLISLLTPRERWQACGLLGLVMLMAAFEVLGTASIMPFIALLQNPGLVDTNPLLAKAYALWGGGPRNEFFFLVGLVVVALTLLALTATATANWFLTRLPYLWGHSLSARLLRTYLAQDYIFFLGRNSSELQKNVLDQIQQLVLLGALPMMQLLGRAIVAAFFIVLLLLVDPVLLIVVGGIIGGIYLVVFFCVQRWLLRMGKMSVDLNAKRYQVLTEAFGGILEIKLFSEERKFVDTFETSSRRFATLQANLLITGLLPRYFLEGFALGTVLVIVLYYLRFGYEIEPLLPIMALYAIAGFRLLPAFQMIFIGLTKVRFAQTALDAIAADLTSLDVRCHDFAHPAEPTPRLTKSIALRGVHFAYPGSEHAALRDVNISIRAGEIVGIVGETGSGKSTLVALLTGLARADRGSLEIDGVPLVNDADLLGWRKSIGYVPQHIFLLDDTVAANIAFGLREDGIDQAQVQRVAKIAQIDTVIHSLPKSYDSPVGERGSRFSGGERQRLGLARALYRNPTVLILDEATSALDESTERAVVSAITDLAPRVTVVMIAHRLSTLKNCNRVYRIIGGMIECLPSSDLQAYVAT